MIHSFAYSMASLMESASRLPEVAPALQHADRQSVDPAEIPRTVAASSMLDSPGVDGLDRGVRLVDVHLDNQFELVVAGHQKESIARLLVMQRRCVSRLSLRYDKVSEGYRPSWLSQRRQQFSLGGFVC
jgi:hypothetical protein